MTTGKSVSTMKSAYTAAGPANTPPAPTRRREWNYIRQVEALSYTVTLQPAA